MFMYNVSKRCRCFYFMYVFSMLSLESRCLKVMLREWCCRWGLFGMAVLLQHCFSLGCGFFFLSLSLLIGWELSIWICCKPCSSLLCNLQLLCFWWLSLSIVVEVFPRPFPKYCSFKDVYYKLVMPTYMPYPWVASIFFKFWKLIFLLSPFEKLHHSLFHLPILFLTLFSISMFQVDLRESVGKRKSPSTPTVLFSVLWAQKYPATSEPNAVAALDKFDITSDASFRHSSVYLTTGSQPLPRQILHSFAI